MSFTKFLKISQVAMKDIFSCLVSVDLFLPYVIILENKSDAVGIKSLVLRVHCALRKSFENINP